MERALRLAPWMQPWSGRGAIRLLLVTETTAGAVADQGRIPIADVLQFGRLDPHVRSHAAILPHCVEVDQSAEAGARWSRAGGLVTTLRVQQSTWTMPGADACFLVQIADVAPDTPREALVACLEDMYYGDFVVEGLPSVERHPHARTHQLVVLPDDGDGPSLDDVQRLVYRADLPADPEFVALSRPAELNRRPGHGAVTGPFVSVLWGQQDYVENLAFTSVMIATAAALTVRDARGRIMERIALLTARVEAAHTSGHSARDIRELSVELSDANLLIARIENQLALLIDGLSTLMPYVPALRAESFHTALFEAIDVERNRVALERMVGRLRSIVSTESEVLRSLADAASLDRTRRWSISIGLASVVTIPFGIVFGFFGVAASQVDAHRSMFAPAYWPIYAIVVGCAAVVAGIHLGLLRLHRRRLGSSAS